MSSASSGTRGKSVPAGNARRASALSAGGSAVLGESAAAGSETGGSAVDPVLRVRDAVFAYPGCSPVLKGVSFDVSAGSVLGFVGRNGAGKTTFIKLAFDVLTLKSGSIEICGKPNTSASAKTDALYLSSGDGVAEFLTGSEYILMLARLYGCSISDSQIAFMFESLGMPGAQSRLASSYSHGMRKKCQLAAAFLLNRPLTVVDETLNGIDVDAWFYCAEQFKRMKRDGLSAVLCTHDFTLLTEVADNMCVLSKGRVKQFVSKKQALAERGTLVEWYKHNVGHSADERLSAERAADGSATDVSARSGRLKV